MDYYRVKGHRLASLDPLRVEDGVATAGEMAPKIDSDLLDQVVSELTHEARMITGEKWDGSADGDCWNRVWRPEVVSKAAKETVVWRNRDFCSSPICACCCLNRD